MKAIIAGGRDYKFTNEDIEWLNELDAKHNIETVVSGCAPGADTCGEQWARLRGKKILKCPANWEKHGKAAGPIRNQQMAEKATALIAFPGGRGTADMISRATKQGLLVIKR